VVDEAGKPVPEIEIRQPISIEIEYWQLADSPEFRPSAYIHMRNAEGVFLFGSWDANNSTWRVQPRRRGLVKARCHIPGNFLAEGTVFVSAGITTIEPTTFHAGESDVVAFHVVDHSDGDGVRATWVGDFGGVLRPMLQWDATIEAD